MRRRAFSNPSVPLDEEKTWKALGPYWDEIVEKFAARGYDQPAKVKYVRVEPDWHDSCRHFAGASEDGTILVVAPEMADLPVPNIKAILAHEAGHFVDFGSPGRFWFRTPKNVPAREGATVLADNHAQFNPQDKHLFFFQDLPVKNLKKHLDAWKSRSKDEVEMTADSIAEDVLRIKIGYTGSFSCLIQEVGKGIKRPIGLR